MSQNYHYILFPTRDTRYTSQMVYILSRNFQRDLSLVASLDSTRHKLPLKGIYYQPDCTNTTHSLINMPSPLQIVSTVSPLILKHRTNHPVTTLCSTQQHHLTKSVLTLRGGATIPKDALDMVHLEGVAPMMTAMSSYAVIGSLIMGSSLYLFDITPKRFKDYEFTKTTEKGKCGSWINRIEKTAIVVFSLVSAISIATSLRTVIIFHVMTLYGNTALSRKSGEDAFALFWYSPLNIKLRRSAFRTFLAALQSFRVAFVLSVFLNTDGKYRYVATAAVASILLLTAVQLQQMVKLASYTIYHHSL